MEHWLLHWGFDFEKHADWSCPHGFESVKLPCDLWMGVYNIYPSTCSVLTRQALDQCRLQVCAHSLGKVCNVKVAFSIKHLPMRASSKFLLLYNVPREDRKKNGVSRLWCNKSSQHFSSWVQKGLIYADIIAYVPLSMSGLLTHFYKWSYLACNHRTFQILTLIFLQGDVVSAG